jgi:hypothetical protein
MVVVDISVSFVDRASDLPPCERRTTPRAAIWATCGGPGRCAGFAFTAEAGLLPEAFDERVRGVGDLANTFVGGERVSPGVSSLSPTLADGMLSWCEVS